jgi:hypothetical protein
MVEIGHVYVSSRRGAASVVKVARKFEVVAMVDQ